MCVPERVRERGGGGGGGGGGTVLKAFYECSLTVPLKVVGGLRDICECPVRIVGFPRDVVTLKQTASGLQ